MPKFLIVSILIGISMLPSKLLLCQPTDCKMGNISEEPATTVREASQFVSALQQALRTEDKKGMADLIHYPLSVGTPSGSLEIKTPDELVAKYKEIFTPAWRRAILQQKYECVNRVGAQGFMLEKGAVWFDEFNQGRMLIFSINPVF